MRDGFRRHPAGVALVVAATTAGPVGLTVSSLASVSADPPALSFSVLRSGVTAAAVATAPRVEVVLLAARHVDVARAFATRGAPRLTTEQGWTPPSYDGGPPRLESAPATFAGRVVERLEVGESWLVVVGVDEVRLGPDAPSLLYADRDYRVLGGRARDV
ncbi:MAG: flavin oxidoreductase [Nocardioides sp.]|nr:flavin oxidoreductase [Nocardioides sp.]